MTDREIGFAVPGGDALTETRRQAERLGRTLRRATAVRGGTGALEALRGALRAAQTDAASLSESLTEAAGGTVQQRVRELGALLRGELSESLTALSALFFGEDEAEESAAALERESEAIGETAASAGRAVRALAAFDEINALVFSRGGSGRKRSAASAGETEPAERELLNFDRTLDRVLSGTLPRLRRSLADFTAWLNGAAARLYEALRMPGVLEKVRTIGSELAAILNDTAADLDWGTLGRALGAGLDLAIQGLTALLFGFDAAALGRGLAALVNGAASEIDWTALGRLLWAGFRLALETLAGLFTGLDMGLLAESASRLMTGYFGAMQETLISIDWDAIGRQITAFLAGLDWGGAVEAAAGALGAALGAGAALLWGFLRSAWESLTERWRTLALEDGRLTAESLWRGITEAWNGCVGFLREKILQPFVNGFRAVFGIHSPSAVTRELGAFLTEGLYLGIESGLGGVTALWQGIFDSFTAYVRGSFLTDWGSAWDSVAARFAGVWQGMSGALESAAGAILSGVNRLAEQVSGIRFTVPDWVPGLGGQSVSLTVPKLTASQIPRMAAGGVVPPNRSFLAMLGDNPRETEVVSPLSTMKQALTEALREAGGLPGGAVTLTVNLDGREIARNQVRHINDMTRAAGRPVLLY